MAWLSLRSRPAFALLVATLAVLLLVSSTSAENFRIATKVFVGAEGKKDTKMVSEATTLFLDGVVYDFLADGSQTAVFRRPSGKSPGKFVILDPAERIQTELTTDQLTSTMTKLREWAGDQKDPMLKFSADPKFKETYEPETGRLVLASYLQSYTVITKPAEHEGGMAEYRQFLNYYTQLNTLLHGGPPPEPRLRLNEALARHRVIPKTVELTRAGEKEPLRAEHEFTWRLSREDMERIDKVQASLVSFREVKNDEFLKAGEVGAAGGK